MHGAANQSYGVKQDDADAVRVYLKAADQGHADTHSNIGVM